MAWSKKFDPSRKLVKDKLSKAREQEGEMKGAKLDREHIKVGQKDLGDR